MSRHRPHPLVRLGYAGLGVLGATLLLGGTLFLVSAISAAWTGQNAGTQLLAVLEGYPLLLNLLLYPLVLIWLVFCRQSLDGRPFSSLGLHLVPRALLPQLAMGALCGGLAIGLLWLLLWLSGSLTAALPSPEVLAAGVGGTLLALLGYLLFFASVAFMEELAFRGYLYHNLHAWLGSKAALFWQALLFALIHLSNVQGEGSAALQAAFMAMPSLLLVGVLFGLMYRKTGSLWFPIGFHWSWNFLLGCVFSLPVSGIAIFRVLDVQLVGSPWVNGGSFGAEASPLLIPILVALIVLIARQPDHPNLLRELAADKHAPTEAAPAQVIDSVQTAAVDSDLEDGGDLDRENPSRYRTRMARRDTFDADFLGELKELQAKREAEIAARAAQEDKLAQAAELVADLAGRPPVPVGPAAPRESGPLPTASPAAASPPAAHPPTPVTQLPAAPVAALDQPTSPPPAPEVLAATEAEASTQPSVEPPTRKPPPRW